MPSTAEHITRATTRRSLARIGERAAPGPVFPPSIVAKLNAPVVGMAAG